MDNFKKGWHVVYTRPQHEKKVVTQLAQSDIEYFLPLVKKLKQWSDRRKYFDAPLFPSYVFIKVPDRQTYFRSLDLNGILYFVRTGREIANVDESVIYNLKHLIALNYNEIAVSSDRISPGEKLVISNGPFAGFNCEVVQHNGKYKALVRIDIIQRNVIVDIPVSSLMTEKAVTGTFSAETF